MVATAPLLQRIFRKLNPQHGKRWPPRPTKAALKEFMTRTPATDINICPPGSTDPSLAVRDSMFFNKLPPELRRQIYVLAFGNGVVHVEDDGTDHLSRMAYFCPYALDWRLPREDDCEDAYGRALDKFGRVLIGVMGWLLSCRLAYIEAIDVLYSANTIRLRSVGMLPRLPNHLPPRILQCITSVELTPKVPLLSIPEDLLCSLPRSIFPRLRKLYLLLSDIDPLPWYPYGVFFGDDRNEATEVVALLKRADRMAQKLLSPPSRLEMFEIAVRNATFQSLVSAQRKQQTTVVQKSPRYQHAERFWRSLGDVDVEVDGAIAVGRNDTKKLGYWIGL
ncbi:hypothetical protein PAAG_07862 [Paracoccidioides lutzii Pb01]|uniref:DUF7730 domain-containing protein n=1 Tax=Paracoccidioides lutzii (strain ATCC MYA-826 / Pb01) TaxID=502779 RepID=C1HAZ8_PARBA|nr:hypothetical protein PAAG_07862 [Paracoccidioides lutzii Pb01]EEH37444.2 hypothetical protein PAAG_07862 [Paracoccidioides lutzii Pb01]